MRIYTYHIHVYVHTCTFGFLPWACTCTLPSLSRPLQEVQAGHQHESDLSSFADSCSQSQSLACQPSQSNMSSFSVFEDSREQSSFVPFHDSWANSSKDTGGPGARPVSSGQQRKEQMGAVQQEVVYRATLGVPLEGEGSGSGNVTTIDQSFTQIGICHPKTAPSISTPISSRIGVWPYLRTYMYIWTLTSVYMKSITSLLSLLPLNRFHL